MDRVNNKIVIIGAPTLDIINNKIKAGGPGIYGGSIAHILGCNVYSLGPLGVADLALLRIYKDLKVNYLGPIRLGYAYRFKHHYTKNRRISKILDKPEPEALSFEDLSPLKNERFNAIIVNNVYCEVTPSLIKWLHLNVRYDLLVIDLQGLFRCYRKAETLINTFQTFYHVSKDDIDYIPKIKGILIYTMGSKGSLIIMKDRTINLSPPNKIFRDPTGAGDIFVTSFTCLFIRKADVIGAAQEAAKLTENFLPEVNELIDIASKEALLEK